MAVLTQWALSMGAFRRNRMPVGKKVLAAALCNGGYSYREASRLLGGMSYIAARDAYLSLLTSLPEERRVPRREVRIDSAAVGVDGRSICLWLARDVDSGEILTFQASPNASVEDANRFLATVGAQCSNRPTLNIHADGFSESFVNSDLYFQAAPAPPDSLIQRIGRFLKVSTK